MPAYLEPRKRWTQQELAEVRAYVPQVYTGLLSYYGAVKLLSSSLPTRSPEAIRGQLRIAVNKEQNDATTR